MSGIGSSTCLSQLAASASRETQANAPTVFEMALTSTRIPRLVESSRGGSHASDRAAEILPGGRMEKGVETVAEKEPR